MYCKVTGRYSCTSVDEETGCCRTYSGKCKYDIEEEEYIDDYDSSDEYEPD